MEEIRCAKCGSDRVIPDAQVFDQGQGSGGQLQLGFYQKPEALLFRGKVTHEITANICGECGYVEFFAQFAPQMYDLYSRANPKEVAADVPEAERGQASVFDARVKSPVVSAEPPAVVRNAAAVEDSDAGIPTECVACGTPLGGADWCAKCGMRYTKG